jgi:hypothetical protein
VAAVTWSVRLVVGITVMLSHTVQVGMPAKIVGSQLDGCRHWEGRRVPEMWGGRESQEHATDVFLMVLCVPVLCRLRNSFARLITRTDSGCPARGVDGKLLSQTTHSRKPGNRILGLNSAVSQRGRW